MRGREGVFGRQPVIDREHLHARAIRQAAAMAVMAVEIAEHEAAAMEIDQQRRWPFDAVRRVESRRTGPSPPAAGDRAWRR